MENEHRACPCLYGEPCSDTCTCISIVSSRGCDNCCTYGSVEQRTAQAERLKAKKYDRIDAVIMINKFAQEHGFDGMNVDKWTNENL